MDVVALVDIYEAVDDCLHNLSRLFLRINWTVVLRPLLVHSALLMLPKLNGVAKLEDHGRIRYGVEILTLLVTA